MKCIFAQGNPGLEYELSRHNVGFLCVDMFARQNNAPFSHKAKFFADIAEFSHEGEKVLLIKPTTFYNETGRSLRAIKDFYKLDTSDMMVIHDDLALEFGKIRIRHKGSDAGNNGIKSLNAALGEAYARLRIGILNELRSRMPDADFVLGKFNSAEQTVLKEHIIPAATAYMMQFLNENLIDESVTIEK